MIFTTAFNHGGLYYYKLHKKKLDNLCGVDSKLKDFLHKVPSICPNDYFFKGPRSSVLKIDIETDVKNVVHDIVLLARIGLESNYYNNAHMNVQSFMLAYDNNTVAMEVPIWLEPEEMELFEHLFEKEGPLSGHIDVLRIEQDGKIWVWDFKPKAHLEKYAHTQTFFYAYMLSKRTNIPLSEFRCGYFDDKNTYIFNPNESNLLKNLKFK